MGGGDLNLKKSWHPSTLKNIERVWRAEQKHDAEQKKIEQLQRELEEERARQEMRQYAEDTGVLRKREEKLDWMYQGPAAMLNREDYLTGRSIDRAFETLQQAEENKESKREDDTIPDSIFAPSGTITVDLVNKIREDPLFVIRKQEEENKKQLLNNPVRMKQLQLLLRQSMGVKTKKSDKASKKKKSKSAEKEKKHKKNSRDRESRDEIKRKHEKEGRKKSSTKDSKFGDRRDEAYRKDRSRSNDKRKSEMSSRRRRNSVSSSSSDFDDDVQRRSHSQVKRKSSEPIPPRKKISADEMARKREEMMSNAKWRDEQRTSNVKQYRKKDEKEDMEEKEKKPGFIRPILNKAAENLTVENRIKSNVYNIQRSHFAMEKNFARR